MLHAYRFNPPGILHPVTVIYELNYGETELKRVEARRSRHLRLGLPFNRPLLRIANALNFNLVKDSVGSKSRGKGLPMLKDVHFGIPSSGVSGGIISLVQGSYEYYQMALMTRSSICALLKAGDALIVLYRLSFLGLDSSVIHLSTFLLIGMSGTCWHSKSGVLCAYQI
ncbi:hypothetical protein K2173_001631 [Erythroxylum novogranatense]|uniref:UFSP2 second domain-containing protein n=1 Tax=Erythroxylum novogranatense TaxID=1862640 RepID=A0AAV8T425_9ROSI|nr:hypothetical protein K2173_001631 [Erythroxylum novogranatense]